MSYEKIMDFGKSMYGKTPGIVYSYHGDGEKEDNVQLRPGRDECKSKYIAVPKKSPRATLNFGNISVTNLKRSLNEQLLEKEEKTKHGSKCPTDENQTPGKPNHGRVSENQILSAGSSLYSKRSNVAIKNTGPVQSKLSREKVNLNKSVTIKKPLLDDLSGVSVKDLSTSLIRLIVKEVREAERPVSDKGDSEENESSELPHEHCLSCFDKNCKEMKNCPVVKCKNKCGEAVFHRCKQREHDEMCKHTIIPCINKTIGCQMEMPRYKLSYHLKHCTKMTEAILSPPIPNSNRLSGNYQQPFSPNRPSVEHKDIHEHCLHCHNIRCSEQQDCIIKRCSNKGCSIKFHACKSREHRRICLFKEIPCINQEYGCQYRFSRILLTEHLRICPVMNFEALGLPPYNLLQNIEQSHHCENCYDSHCTLPVNRKCMMKECFCGTLLHACKWDDHYENTCPAFVMCCINFDAGCKMILTRGMLTTHLFHCPAMNWQLRKQLPSKEGSDESEYYTINEILESTVKNDSDEHVYEKLPKRKKKRKRNCKVM